MIKEDLFKAPELPKQRFITSIESLTNVLDELDVYEMKKLEANYKNKRYKNYIKLIEASMIFE